jgi:energy-coupling factor transport system substrate-specific component
MKKLLLLLCMTCLFTANVQARTDTEYFLANYLITLHSSMYNNFPSDEANAVLQTRDGFIWFGGYQGLHRYDGARFTVWDALTPDGFGSSAVRALYEDDDGVLWIGTNDRGIAALENGVFTVYGRTSGLPANTVRTLTGDGAGRIWGGTTEGLFYIDRERNITHVELETDTRQFVTSLVIDSEGNVFAVFGSGELYVLSADGKTSRHELGENERARAVGLSGDGSVVVGTISGRVYVLCSSNPYELTTPHGGISSVFTDSDGRIWILSDHGSGFINENRVFNDMGRPNNEGFFTDMLEDYQGGFWFTATRGGIAKLSPSVFTNVGGLSGTVSGPTNAVVKWRDLMFIGSDAGLIIYDSDWNPVHEEFSTLFETRIRGILACSKGYIWLATHEGWGVVRYNPLDGTYVNWTTADGLSTDRTRFVYEIPNDVIVIGTSVGVNFIQNGRVVSAGDVFGTGVTIRTPEIMVLSAAYTPDGTLFIGTDGDGIYALSRSGYTHITEKDGLQSSIVLRMLYDARNGGVWVAANGLSFIDSNRNVNVIEKVPSLSLLDIMQYGDDLLLMNSSSIMRTNAEALLVRHTPFTYAAVNSRSGLNAQVNANAWNMLTGDGQLFFNTDRGVKILNLEKELESFIPFAGVSEIYIDYVRQTNLNEKISIPNDADRLTVTMSLLSFGFIDDAVLRYMLAGQDAEPVTLVRGDNMEISYTNLRGGEYIFRVWTENPFGDIGNLIEIEFYKKPTIFEYTAVRAVLVIFALLLTAGLSFYIGSRLRKRG